MEDETLDSPFLTSDEAERNEPVEVEDEAAADLTAFDPDDKNLERFFDKTEEGKAFLAALSKQVVEDFDRAWESSEEYRAKREENFRVMTGFLQEKEFPFEGCANAHAPIMLERLLRLSSNVFTEIFTDRGMIFMVQPTGPDDQQVADVLTRHGNWQLRTQLTDFLRQQHRGLQEFFATGSVFCHSYYDSVRRRNRHDILTCDEFVMPYVFTTVETDLSDVPYKIRRIRKFKAALQELDANGDWSNIGDVLAKKPSSKDDEPGTPNRDQVAQFEGVSAPDDDPAAPYEFYDYYGWATLPQGKRQRPINVVVDKGTGTIVKLVLREEDDWQDKLRYERESAEWEQWKQDMAAYQRVQAKEGELHAMLQNPALDAMDVMTIKAALQAQPVQPPVPPRWMVDELHMSQGPDPVKRVPVEMFSHGVCIENPMGTMGLSYGNILADENKLADEALNRFYDSATLANCWSLLIPENMNLDQGTIPFGPGKIIRIKGAVSGEQIKGSIVELRPGPANQQLIELARAAGEWADGVTVSGIVSGEPGKSGETFRGVATRLERATKQLSVAGIKYLEFLSNILKNNAKLNSLFMPEDEVFLVNDDLGAPELMQVGRRLYERNYQVTFAADVRFATQAQKIAEKDEILQLITQFPPLQSNPGFVYQALAGALKARGMQELIPFLGPPPPPPQVPMGTPQPPSGGPGVPAPGPQSGGPPSPGEAQGAPPASPPGADRPV